MKRAERILMTIALLAMTWIGAFAQTKIDEERMERDIEVAENILSTMIKQQFDKRNFFPIEVKGSYRTGYGVTFTIPNIQSNMLFGNFDMPEIVWSDGPGNFSRSYSNGDAEGFTIIQRDAEGDVSTVDRKGKSTTVAGTPAPARAPRARKEKSKAKNDSLKEESNEKTIKAIKEFIADYGDLIGQLAPSERIIVTNRGEEDRMWFGQFNNQNQPTYLSIEATKGDVTQYKQGKLTREQLFGKLKVVNTKSETELQPDLELLASIFNRLYRSDLSKTFFTQENTYYERLKDFGVIYYMQVYSSNQQGEDIWSMPTVSLDEVDQKTRDKKVKELYPLFAKSIKEDMLEYGRTLKSLKDEENLILNIVLTRCRGCEIPSTLELSIKNSVLKDFSSGKLTKEAALQKITEKKGADQ
jgi:hypothetical protein